MQEHTTNYTDTFIQVADDSPAAGGETPPTRGEKKSVANLQFELLNKHPYKYTSDDVLFKVYAERNDLAASELKKAREDFFSKGQPCLRASPLTKRYGWGIHSDSQGKIALIDSNSIEYRTLSESKSVKVLKAMKSAK